MLRAASQPFSVGECRGRSKHWKQSHVLATGPDRRSTSSHKNRACRPHNGDGLWISNDSIMFAPDTDNPFWLTWKLTYAEHNSLQHIFQVKQILWCWKDHSCQFHRAKTLIIRNCEWVLKKTASGKNDSRGHIKKPVNVAGKQGHTEVVVYETCIPLAWWGRTRREIARD